MTTRVVQFPEQAVGSPAKGVLWWQLKSDEISGAYTSRVFLFFEKGKSRSPVVFFLSLFARVIVVSRLVDFM